MKNMQSPISNDLIRLLAYKFFILAMYGNSVIASIEPVEIKQYPQNMW